MTLPVFLHTRGCGQLLNMQRADTATKKRLCAQFCGLAALDLALFITTLVLGILGAKSIIHIPPAATYSLLGVSVGIAALWLSLPIVKACWKFFPQAAQE